ncbi:MAG: AAA family ATPase [Clostridia bacterium]|nr:AAA family ATPase [Clostridia bacterium]
MDKRDEIIRTQMDVIETLISNNMRRVADDFWGSPSPAPKAKPQQPEEKKPVPQEKAPEQSSAPQEEALPVEDIDDLKAELNELIGLGGVKKEVNNLINMVTVHKLRQQHGLKSPDMSLHMVFSGNPGTGKTTIARMMARIYRSLGILSKGQLVEVDRSGLVAGYVGQTATKTSKVIEGALGGVLFIDEAYALNSNSENDFGQEAINTLLKAMEDHREDLVVIVAGYDGLMDTFIHSNPGLESRFNRYLHFDDYNVDEMLAILDMQLKKGQYTLDEAARAAAKEYIEASNTSSIAFGNARGIRNIFEKLMVEQANRLSKEENLSKEALMCITEADVLAARANDTQLAKAELAKKQMEENTKAAIEELQNLMK